MDEKTVASVVERLRRVSDALILEKSFDLARTIDRACAFMEMNDAANARSELDKAVAAFPQDRSDYRVVAAARAALPSNDTVNPRVSKKLTRVEDGFLFEQYAGEPESTILVPVTDATTPKDVTCEFKMQSIVVSVREDVVIDGRLSHPVVLDGCMWSLTTDGPQRILSVALEKKDPQYEWPALLRSEDETFR